MTRSASERAWKEARDGHWVSEITDLIEQRPELYGAYMRLLSRMGVNIEAVQDDLKSRTGRDNLAEWVKEADILAALSSVPEGEGQRAITRKATLWDAYQAIKKVFEAR